MKTSIATICLGVPLSIAPRASAQTVTTSWSICVSPAYHAPYGGTCVDNVGDPINNVAFGTGSGEPASQQLSLGCDISSFGFHFQASGNIQVAATGLQLTARAQASTNGIHISGTNSWPGGRAYVRANAKGTDVVTIGANGDYVYELRFEGTFDAQCTSDEQSDGTSLHSTWRIGLLHTAAKNRGGIKERRERPAERVGLVEENDGGAGNVAS